ncbi:hypothetical protein [Lysobacter sp. CA199]|uniref:hypothetical protein n=1 Tax=Lysobacter sp. CA199 TaxID=3455608 RepID=UPI003F8D2F8C
MSSQAQTAAAGRQFIEQLEASLRERPNLDAADRDFLLKHFRDAFENAEASGRGFDRQAWTDSVAQLGLGEAEQDALLQKFDQAFGGMEGETRDLGDEFVRRLASEGEAKAQQWLHEQIGKIKRTRGADAAVQVVQGLPPQIGKVAAARKPGPWG